MKVICKGVEESQSKICPYEFDCFHSEPHEIEKNCSARHLFAKCRCIPLPLEWLMKEVLK